MSDAACAECARLEDLYARAEKEKVHARRIFDSQHTVAGAKERAERYSAAAATCKSAFAELSAHRATHLPS